MQAFYLVLLAIFVGVVILSSNWLGQQAYNWLPPPAAAEADYVGHLFSFLVTLGSFVFLGVLGMLIFSIIRYRVSPSDTNDAPPIRGYIRLEITWTVIPILLVIVIASYNYSIYQRMNILGSLPLVHLHPPLEAAAYAQDGPTEMRPAGTAATKAPGIPEMMPEEIIEVMSKQWAWSFRYPDHNVTSRELHLPINRRAHLRLQSADVLHGFFVPNFRIKQDIVPNRTIDFRFTPNRVGKYQLHDSQFSGTYFAVMTADVYVDTPEAYEQWLTQAKNQPLTAEVDPATAEHQRPPQTPLRSNWPTLQPRKWL